MSKYSTYYEQVLSGVPLSRMAHNYQRRRQVCTFLQGEAMFAELAIAAESELCQTPNIRRPVRMFCLFLPTETDFRGA